MITAPAMIVQPNVDPLEISVLLNPISIRNIILSVWQPEHTKITVDIALKLQTIRLLYGFPFSLNATLPILRLGIGPAKIHYLC